MPPIRKKQAKITDKRYSKYFKKKGRPVKNYNKSIQNYQRKGSNMLKIRTLIPKELNVGIQYKTTLVFSSMGSGGTGCIATLIKINLNDPIQGNTLNGSAIAGNIVDVVSLGGTYLDPSFVRTNGSQMNLSTELAPYFDQYKKCVVLSSNSNVRIVGRPNQYKLNQWQSNADAAGSNGTDYPWAANHPPYLQTNDATLDGEMYVSSIKQRNTLGLHPLPSGQTPSFHQLQTSTPGLKMRRMTMTPNSTGKSVASCAKYTPKYTGIKDWRDNISDLGVRTPSGTKTQTKPAYHYVAVHNREPATANFKPANVVAEIVVNYNVRFLDRANDFEGGDDPLPQPVHGEDL